MYIVTLGQLNNLLSWLNIYNTPNTLAFYIITFIITQPTIYMTMESFLLSAQTRTHLARGGVTCT